MGSLIRGNRGQSVVEFALVLPVLLLVLFGITEFGRAVMTKNVLTSAAREGARLAIVTAPDTDAVRTRVTAVCTAAGITPSSITITGPDVNTHSIRVTVRSDFEFLGEGILNYFKDGPEVRRHIQIGSSSVMRHETLQP